MSQRIDDVAALEACIGKTPKPVQLKVIDYVDEGAQHWIAASPLLFAAFSDGAGVAITLGGGEPGFVRATAPQRLELPAQLLDEPQLARVGMGFGALFVAPGIGETLRVNGNVTATNGETIEIAVTECYVHCAKALIRSEFWKASLTNSPPTDAAAFLTASRFIALATADCQCRTDVSPKGDPQGAMIRLENDGAWFADRPGNRRADSFRNILVQPNISLAALLPGSTQIALLSGRAQIVTDEKIRTSFAVAEKTPLLATHIEQPQCCVLESAALARAQLWPLAKRAEGIDPAAIIVSHLKGSNQRGLQASLVRMAVSVPGLMEKGLEHDYKHNLY